MSWHKGQSKNRPRDSGTMFKKFLEWNFYGDGKRLSPMRSTSYWYRDDIFYRNWKPVARAMTTGRGTHFVFLKFDEYFNGRKDQDHLILKENIVDVDSVGAIGPSGLIVPQYEFLLSVLQQFVGKAHYFVEMIGHVAPVSAWDHFDLKAKHSLTAHNYAFHQWMFDGWSDQIRTMGENYDRINELFELGEPGVDFEGLYQQFWRIVKAKATIHAEPHNAAKRERAKARREAVRALNIGEG